MTRCSSWQVPEQGQQDDLLAGAAGLPVQRQLLLMLRERWSLLCVDRLQMRRRSLGCLLLHVLALTWLLTCHQLAPGAGPLEAASAAAAC